MTTPFNAELREATCLVVVKWISELPEETTELVNIKHDEWQKLYTELASLFQAREQQLIAELVRDLSKQVARYGDGKIVYHNDEAVVPISKVQGLLSKRYREGL